MLAMSFFQSIFIKLCKWFSLPQCTVWQSSWSVFNPVCCQWMVILAIPCTQEVSLKQNKQTAWQQSISIVTNGIQLNYLFIHSLFPFWFLSVLLPILSLSYLAPDCVCSISLLYTYHKLGFFSSLTCFIVVRAG